MYSGVDGMAIAAEAAGIEVVAHCEPVKYCRERVAVQWPGTKIYHLDTDITADRLRADGVWPLDIIFGGPPCQAASSAGKRLGESDPRWRWPEFLRVVREVRPRWICAENPKGIISLQGGRAIREIHAELAGMGYRTGQGLYGVDALGAPHQRDRVFITAYLAHPSHDQHDQQ